MRGEVGHAGYGADMHIRHPLPADDGGVVTVDGVTDLQRAASAADDLAGVHVAHVAYTNIERQRACWKKHPMLRRPKHKMRL